MNSYGTATAEVAALKNGKIISKFINYRTDSSGNKYTDTVFEIRSSTGNRTKDPTVGFGGSIATLVTLGPDKFMLVDSQGVHRARFFDSNGNSFGELDLGFYTSIVGLDDGRFAVFIGGTSNGYQRVEIRTTEGVVEASLAVPNVDSFSSLAKTADGRLVLSRAKFGTTEIQFLDTRVAEDWTQRFGHRHATRRNPLRR